MRLLVADGQRLAREAAARGEEVAVWGPSPGFRDLRWIKPVLAGDTISYANVVNRQAHLRLAPRLGHPEARTTGTNQRGEEVYSITASPSCRCGRAVRPVPG